MSATGLVAVLSLAPGPGVPPDLVAQAHEGVVRELGASAIVDTAESLRRVDDRTGVRTRFATTQERARRLRVEFFDDAVAAAREAVAVADGGFLALTDPERVAEARMLSGSLELDAGRPEMADDAFVRALAVQPAIRADPARISPAAREALDRIPRPACASLAERDARRAAEALGAERLVVLRACLEGGRVRVHATEVWAREGGRSTERDVAVPLGASLASRDVRRLIGLRTDEERPWYKRPWVWIAAGAVAGVAVVVPLATAEETGDVRVHW